MKTVKVSLVALALTLGVAGAFATNAASSKHQSNPNWQQVTATGTLVHDGTYLSNATQATAESSFGCSGSGDDCAAIVDHKNGSIITPATYIKKN